MYFVTTSVGDRACVLSEVRGNEAILTAAGAEVRAALEEVTHRFAGVELDAHVIMPDHVHVIFHLKRDDGPSLQQIVGRFKGLSARRINLLSSLPRTGSIWHRGYHDRVIRTAGVLARIRLYIAANPRHWNERRLHPPPVH